MIQIKQIKIVALLERSVRTAKQGNNAKEQELVNVNKELTTIFEQKIKEHLPSEIEKEMIKIIDSFFCPDPAKRGYTGRKAKSYTQFSLLPYISKIANLSKSIILRG